MQAVLTVLVVLGVLLKFVPYPIDLWLFGQFVPPDIIFSPVLWLWKWSFGGVVVSERSSGASI